MLVMLSIFLTIITIELALIIWFLIFILHEIEEFDKVNKSLVSLEPKGLDVNYTS